MKLEIYKKGQGKLARGVALGGVAFLGLYASRSLYWAMDAWTGGRSHGAWFRLPILDAPVNLALIVSGALLLGLVGGVFLAINRPRVADLLIETELESRKITWPSWQEAFNAAMVVIGTSVLLAILLMVFDLGLEQVFRRIFSRVQ